MRNLSKRKKAKTVSSEWLDYFENINKYGAYYTMKKEDNENEYGDLSTNNGFHINDLKEKKVNNHLYRKVRMCEIRTKKA